MENDTVFTIQLAEQEWQRFDALAQRLQRTREDTFRWFLRQIKTTPERPPGCSVGQLRLPLWFEGD